MKVSLIRTPLLVLCTVLCSVPLPAATLGQELTPVGAQRAGNADGSIPRWSADQLSDEAHLQWMQRITREEPLYIITADNLQRYRQWLTHKLGSWHEQYGRSGCVGCGRCITWCPVGIDITAEAETICSGGDAQEGRQ
mgnify:CR=1 FL=1